MAMLFSILGSSSSGNSGLIVTENSKVLVDAGFSCKRLCAMLEERDTSPEEIDAIFLTHEHSDHTAGVSTFCKQFDVPVYANALTARALQAKLKLKPRWKLFHTDSTFCFQDLTVESFSLPHDAHDPVGFVFRCGGEDLFTERKSVAWLTDLGFAPQHISRRIQHVDTLVVEANYDEQMLQRDPNRPWSVKQRISGRHGHLSNESARNLLDSVESPSWSRVFLAHLSSDCNSAEAIGKTFASLRDKGSYILETIEAGEGSLLAAV